MTTPYAAEELKDCRHDAAISLLASFEDTCISHIVSRYLINRQEPTPSAMIEAMPSPKYDYSSMMPSPRHLVRRTSRPAGDASGLADRAWRLSFLSLHPKAIIDERRRIEAPEVFCPPICVRRRAGVIVSWRHDFEHGHSAHFWLSPYRWRAALPGRSGSRYSMMQEVNIAMLPRSRHFEPSAVAEQLGSVISEPPDR